MDSTKRIKTLQHLGIITLTLVALYYFNELFGEHVSIFLKALNSIVLPFGIALFLSYLLNPLIKLLEEKVKIKKRIYSIIIVFTLLLVAVALFGIIVGNIIYNQAASFVEVDWGSIVSQVEEFVSGNQFLSDLYAQVEPYLTFESATPIFGNLVSYIEGAVSIIMAVVLTPVFLVFLLSDRNTIFKGILWVIPMKYQKEIEELAARANDVTEKYFNGRFIIMLISSVLFTIMFLVFGFGVDKAIFFGFVLGFLDIIPYVGSFIGIALPVLYSFTISDQLLMGKWAFVGIILVNFVIQALQGNVMQPIIMGKEVKLHPLLILSSFIFFGALFGITGVILAIPITGTLKTTMEYYRGKAHG